MTTALASVDTERRKRRGKTRAHWITAKYANEQSRRHMRTLRASALEWENSRGLVWVAVSEVFFSQHPTTGVLGSPECLDPILGPLLCIPGQQVGVQE